MKNLTVCGDMLTNYQVEKNGDMKRPYLNNVKYISAGKSLDSNI